MAAVRRMFALFFRHITLPAADPRKTADAEQRLVDLQRRAAALGVELDMYRNLK